MKIIKKIKNIIPSIISEVGFKCKEFCHWYGNGTIFQCVFFKFVVHYILLKLFENLRFSTTSIYDNKTEQKIADVIKNMTTKDARRIGLSKMQMFRLKKKVIESKRIMLKRKTLNKLIQHINFKLGIKWQKNLKRRLVLNLAKNICVIF